MHLFYNQYIHTLLYILLFYCILQEEPWSLGFSSYVIPRIEKATGKGVTFVGQPLTRDSYYTRLSNTALNKILHTIFNN